MAYESIVKFLNAKAKEKLADAKGDKGEVLAIDYEPSGFGRAASEHYIRVKYRLPTIPNQRSTFTEGLARDYDLQFKGVEKVLEEVGVYTKSCGFFPNPEDEENRKKGISYEVYLQGSPRLTIENFTKLETAAAEWEKAQASAPKP